MKALTWQGNQHVEVIEVAHPVIQESNGAIVRIISTAICGSDLHLYGVLGPYLSSLGPRPTERSEWSVFEPVPDGEAEQGPWTKRWQIPPRS